MFYVIMMDHLDVLSADIAAERRFISEKRFG